MNKFWCFLLFSLICISLAAQDSLHVVRVNAQRSFSQEIPAGNYSGITYLGNDLYAVVSDKSPNDGFFIFKISLDSITGEVLRVENLGFRGDREQAGDLEAIAYVPTTKKLYISRETDNTIREYTLDGKLSDRKILVPPIYQRARGNYGLESLNFNPKTQMFWTCNEGTLKGDGEQATSTNQVKNRLRLQSFSADFTPLHQYAYQMETPEADKRAYLYGMGVVEVTGLDDGSVLVMEREFYTPTKKVGAFVNNKLFRVMPQAAFAIDNNDSLTADSPYLQKQLVASWRTTLKLFHHKIANFEGMCLGPQLADGSQVLVFVSDSQNQAGGVMKDWFKTLVFKMSSEK
ncbi:esterase-like activity of phytase family protein [Hoylesella timonensis]|uniref:Phytase esterase n=1 Tax=Hoylesella timonensis S9-PR14 TaxID=1401062 RepID=A0A098YR77_9BACT|nr:esterase-like activity of phytase family protein [Hoylesella timonensis]KGI22210.1 phytase esterase [Hoylesella timonensis S9-PR14]